MSEFRIGDRVRVHSRVGSPAHGAEGVIEEIHNRPSSSPLYKVKLNNVPAAWFFGSNLRPVEHWIPML